MNLGEFLATALEPDPPLRRGQSLMNRLYRIRPDLYSLVVDYMELNPFYDDGDFWPTIQYIRDNWDIPVQTPEKVR